MYLNDHGATWFCDWYWGPHQRRFVLWEPYAANINNNFLEVVRLARADGLKVGITASVWDPPSSVGICFEPIDNRVFYDDCDCGGYHCGGRKRTALDDDWSS